MNAFYSAELACLRAAYFVHEAQMNSENTLFQQEKNGGEDRDVMTALDDRLILLGESKACIEDAIKLSEKYSVVDKIDPNRLANGEPTLGETIAVLIEVSTRVRAAHHSRFSSIQSELERLIAAQGCISTIAGHQSSEDQAKEGEDFKPSVTDEERSELGDKRRRRDAILDDALDLLPETSAVVSGLQDLREYLEPISVGSTTVGEISKLLAESKQDSTAFRRTLGTTAVHLGASAYYMEGFGWVRKYPEQEVGWKMLEALEEENRSVTVPGSET